MDIENERVKIREEREKRMSKIESKQINLEERQDEFSKNLKRLLDLATSTDKSLAVISNEMANIKEDVAVMKLGLNGLVPKMAIFSERLYNLEKERVSK